MLSNPPILTLNFNVFSLFLELSTLTTVNFRRVPAPPESPLAVTPHSLLLPSVPLAPTLGATRLSSISADWLLWALHPDTRHATRGFVMGFFSLMLPKFGPAASCVTNASPLSVPSDGTARSRPRPPADGL